MIQRNRAMDLLGRYGSSQVSVNPVFEKREMSVRLPRQQGNTLGMGDAARKKRIAMALGLDYGEEDVHFASNVSNPHSPSGALRLGRMSSHGILARRSNRLADRVSNLLTNKYKSSRAIHDYLENNLHSHLDEGLMDDDPRALMGSDYDVTGAITEKNYASLRTQTHGPPAPNASHTDLLLTGGFRSNRNSNLYSRLKDKSEEMTQPIKSEQTKKGEADKKPAGNMYAPSARNIAGSEVEGIRKNPFKNIESIRMLPRDNLEENESITSRPDSITERYKKSKEGFERMRRDVEAKKVIPAKRKLTGSLVEEIRAIPSVISPRNRLAGQPPLPPTFKPMGLFSKKPAKEEVSDRKMVLPPRDGEDKHFEQISAAKRALEDPLSDDLDLEVELPSSRKKTAKGSTKIGNLPTRRPYTETPTFQPLFRPEIQRKKK